MRSILALILGLTPLFASAAEAVRSLDQLDLRIWNTDQGLPHNSVLSIGQTRDGMLWVGTWGGLARFDGVEFRTYTRDNTGAIGDNGVLTLIPSASGGLWVGTHRGGLLRIEQGRIEPAVAVGTSIGGHVLALLERGDSVWIGTEGAGLYRYRAGAADKFSDERLAADATVPALAADRDGAILVGSRHGMIRIEPDGASSAAVELPAELRDSAVTGIAVNDAGELWLAGPLGVWRRAADRTTWLRVSAIASVSVALGRRGQIWIGTPAQGVLRIDGAQVQQLRTVHGLPDSRVRAVLEDRAGGIWLGTNGGLVGLQSLPFGSIGGLQGLSNDYVRSVLEVAGQGTWIATARGLNLVVDGKVRTYEGAAELADLSVLALAADRSGTLWLGTYADGMLGLRAGTRVTAEGLTLPNPQVRAILIARDGSYWIGTQGGLAHYDPLLQRMLPLPAGVPGASIMSLHQDTAGRIWIGTSEGMARVDGAQAIEFGPAQGFPGEAVFAFLEPVPGRLWIASDAGLIHHAADRFTVIGPAQGLPFYSVLGIQLDASDNFWLASGTGVLRLASADVEAALGGARGRLDGRLFTRDDGMPSNQCNGGSQPSTLHSSSGQLWFATARGVAVVDPLAIDDRTPSPPNVVINRITVDDHDVPLTQAQDLGPGRHTIAVQFAAIALSRQGMVDNAYRVRGLDERWEHIGSERSVRLTTIPPGEYVLEVAARYGNGELTAQPAWFRFSVQPMLLQRPWFIAALVLLAMLAAVAIYRRRTAQLRLRSAELTRLVAQQTQALAREMAVIAERDREKSLLLDELGAKSHELERLAREDGLTRLFNRRHFDERLTQMLAAGTVPAVMLFDLDHFKSVNDSRSHHVGDLVLQRFAALLREEFGDGLVGRYGGEEFAIALADAGELVARSRAEKLRARVAGEDWSAIDPGLCVTVSAGVACDPSLQSPERLIAAADARLYVAKRAGRNRVA